MSSFIAGAWWLRRRAVWRLPRLRVAVASLPQRLRCPASMRLNAV